MNLIEQIKQKAAQAKNAISSVFNKGNSMSFPTTSEALSKSTQIGKNEEAKGYYGKQDNSIINSSLLGEIKNKVGLNYQDAQIRAWREGLKTGSPQLAAKMGNNPALYNVDMTGSIAAKPAKQVAKNIGEEIKPVAKNIFEQAKKFKNVDEFISSQISKDYRSPHQIKSTNTITIDKIDIDKLKQGMKEKKGWLNNYDLNDLNKLKRLQNNPEKEITIYRASPVKELNEGDWVTADRIYANDIKRQNGGHVYSYKVKVKDLRFPNDIESLPSASMASAFQYNPRISELTDIFNKANKPQNIFQGFKDISTKLLEDLKGKSIVNKSFIEQRLISSDLNLKQVEKDLIRSKLANYPDRFDVSEFTENIKTDLLPLNIAKGNKFEQSGLGAPAPRYENITLPHELRGNVQNYAEHIYESPIKTSAGNIHFPGQTDNYFGHTRIEDLADSSLDKALRKPGGTRRVIEVQTDLYQKGRLEREVKTATDGDKWGIIEKDNTFDAKFKTEQEAIESTGINKLQQYNDPTAHYRMVREEVKLAAQDGKTKLQFPTGETAMKIEGLSEVDDWKVVELKENGFLKADKKLDEKEMFVGNRIIRRGENPDHRLSTTWIITDVLEDGKFKAVQKKDLENLRTKQDQTTDELINKLKKMFPDDYGSIMETFDISGKVDTNNPIYKFYEKDLGKYLTSKFNAKQITDERGIKWYELEVKPEWKDKPVEAFGFSTIENTLKTTGVLGAGAALGTGGLALNNYAQKKLDERKQLKLNNTENIENTNIEDNTFLNVPKEKVVQTLINAESFGGDEEAFKGYLASSPSRSWRLELEDSENKYGDVSKFGWVVGFTIPTMESIIEGAKREMSDKRQNIGRPNSELLKKLNFDTKENAINSALEYWKFKNQYYDANSFPIGTKYEDIEEAYTNIYNASDINNGDREQARKNWQTHFND